MHPTVPVVHLWDWLPAAFDPVLIVIAVWLGWKADQFGKVMIVAMAALAISVLVSWAISSMGLPWIAPVRSDALTLFPVRFVAALLWASGAYAARRVARLRQVEDGTQALHPLGEELGCGKECSPSLIDGAGQRLPQCSIARLVRATSRRRPERAADKKGGIRLWGAPEED